MLDGVLTESETGILRFAEESLALAGISSASALGRFPFGQRARARVAFPLTSSSSAPYHPGGAIGHISAPSLINKSVGGGRHISGAGGGEGAVRVLVVCTANRGRSPIAAAILRRMLTERGLDDRVTVESAGLCVYELDMAGRPANPASAAVAAKHRLDLGGHIARPLRPSLVEQSHLVIVMETWQASVLRTLFRDRATMIYTLRELAGPTEDPDTPDIAGATPDAIEEYVAEAERCLRAGLRAGPLASVVNSHLGPLGSSGTPA